MKLSSLSSTQSWINQFSSEDKYLARELLDNLTIIKTETVVNSITAYTENLINSYNSVVIYSIRELLNPEESFFSLTNDKEIPTLQVSNEALGSEAFISNVITHIKRKHSRKLISSRTNKHTKIANLYQIRDKAVDSIILIDDLIGSGKRTVDFLESIYKHPSIKSWLSGKHLTIDVISYSATKKGKTKVKKWLDKKGLNLHVLSNCPMLESVDNFEKISDLCVKYANKTEKYPLGFGEDPVSIVFTHSAPNNLPSILYRSAFKYASASKYIKLTSWMGLFPARAFPIDIRNELNISLKTFNSRHLIFKILDYLSFHATTEIPELIEFTSIKRDKLDFILDKCKKINLLNITNNNVSITEKGKFELDYLRDKMIKKQKVVNNTENYYPKLGQA
ncbi:hypothetical protein AADZ86_15670 [Colwelliaceae bacterium BS250]